MIESIYWLHVSWLAASGIVIFAEKYPARIPGKAPVTTYEECLPIANTQSKAFKDAIEDAIDRAMAKDGKCLFTDVKVECEPSE